MRLDATPDQPWPRGEVSERAPQRRRWHVPDHRNRMVPSEVVRVDVAFPERASRNRASGVPSTSGSRFRYRAHGKS